MMYRQCWLVLSLFLMSFLTPAVVYSQAETTAESSIVETDVATTGSSFSRAFGGGPIVTSVLLCLIVMSVLSWAIVGAKWLLLKRTAQNNDTFLKDFWSSASLSELHKKLDKKPDSSAKSLFRAGYEELVRSNQVADTASEQSSFISAAMTNLNRTLHKTRREEKQSLEKYLPILAISASAAPFIGLFGTVWGIMNAFDGIAQSGNASLAAVAPGISEALIATAFGLAAAIPAVIGYNAFLNMIRGQIVQLESFSVDILNIVERHLVSGEETSPEPEK